jgi:hypothetical protein
MRLTTAPYVRYLFLYKIPFPRYKHPRIRPSSRWQTPAGPAANPPARGGLAGLAPIEDSCVSADGPTGDGLPELPKLGVRPLANQNIPTSHYLDKRADSIAAQIAALPDDTLLSTADLACWLGVSIQFLTIGRSRGYGPAFVRLSATAVRYRVSNVRRWLTERTFARTAEFTGGKGLADEHRAAMRAGWAKRRERLAGEAEA